VRSWIDLTVATYAAMVTSRTHWAQAGYRDGEFAAILGHSGKNINGEVYTPELGAALTDTLMHPVGQWCMLWWPHPTIGAQVYRDAVAWIEQHKPPVDWLPERPIFRAVLEGAAAPFFKACRTRRVVIVGPQHLEALDLFDVARLVPVPKGDAWKHADELADEVLQRSRPGDLILVAAGMGANLIVHRLWPRVHGRATVLDIGSTLDPYAGVYSRGPFRDEHWQSELMAKNRP
jgi:hypothetical protein